MLPSDLLRISLETSSRVRSSSKSKHLINFSLLETQETENPNHFLLILNLVICDQSMDMIFILLTQLINHTTFDLDFKVADGGRRLLPSLPRGKTRFAEPYPVLRRINESDRPWKFRILLNGEFTDIEMDPWVVVKYLRVEFRVDREGERDVLCVEGVRENLRSASDVLLRHRYLGCMRNSYWDRRPVESIDRFDTKLRNVEGHCQHLAPYVDVQNRDKEDKNKGSKTQQPRQKPRIDPQPPNPPKAKNVATADHRQKGTRDVTRHLDNVNNINTPRPPHDMGRVRPYDVAPAQRARPINDESSSTNVVEKDGFVHGMLLFFAFIVAIWMRFF